MMHTHKLSELLIILGIVMWKKRKNRFSDYTITIKSDPCFLFSKGPFPPSCRCWNSRQKIRRERVFLYISRERERETKFELNFTSLCHTTRSKYPHLTKWPHYGTLVKISAHKYCSTMPHYRVDEKLFVIWQAAREEDWTT